MTCLSPAVISSAGLILDILGVILLFYYGLPEEISKNWTRGSFYLGQP